MTGIPAWASGTVLSALPAERVRSLDELEPISRHEREALKNVAETGDPSAIAWLGGGF
jgi:hypothetical protein